MILFCLVSIFFLSLFTRLCWIYFQYDSVERNIFRKSKKKKKTTIFCTLQNSIGTEQSKWQRNMHGKPWISICVSFIEFWRNSTAAEWNYFENFVMPRAFTNLFGDFCILSHAHCTLTYTHTYRINAAAWWVINFWRDESVLCRNSFASYNFG